MRKRPGVTRLVLRGAGSLFLGGLVLGAAAVRRRPRGAITGLALMGVPLLAIVLRAQAEVAPIFSWKPLARRIVAHVPASVEIVFEAPAEYHQGGGLAASTGRRPP